MATTKTWTGGANNNDVSDLANWNEATAFADGDTYIFDLTDTTSTKVPTTGTMTTGAAAIYVTSRSIASIGDGTNFPTFGNGADTQALIQIAGKGALYHFAIGGSGGATLVDLRGGVGTVRIGGSNPVATLRARGYSLIDLGASVVLTTLFATAAPRIVAAANGTAITTAELTDGSKLETSRDVTTGVITDSTVISKATAKFATSGTFYGRGRYVKQSSGTEALVKLLSSRSEMTCEGNPNVAATVTALQRVPGSRLVKASGACTLAVTETLVGGDDGAAPGE